MRPTEAAGALGRPRRNVPGWPSLVGVAVLLVALVRAAFDAGGYFAPAHLELGVTVFATLGVLLLFHLPRHRITGPSLVAIGCLAGLCAWTALSTLWSPQPDEGMALVRLAVVYLGIVALAVVAAGSGRGSALLPWGALAVATVVVGAGLLSRIQPDVVTGIADVTGFSGYRLSYPLTYFNAFGAFAAFGTVLATGLAADPRSRAATRALAAALAVPLVTAMYLSLSRGAWLSLFLGVAVLLLLTPYKLSAAATVGMVAVALAIVLGRLSDLPALVEDPLAGEGQEAAGDGFTVLVAVVSLAVGATVFTLARVRTSWVMQDIGRRVGPRAVAAGALLAIAVGASAYAAAGGAIEGESAGTLSKASDWVDRQWEDFRQTTAFGVTGAGRLSTSKGTRSDLYGVALDAFADHPLQGDGAGGYEWRWFRDRDAPESLSDAHSLGLHTLAELGLVGGALLLGFLGALVAGAAVTLRPPSALRRGQTAAVAAAVSVWMGHTMVDWDWRMPAFTGTALLAAAALLPPGAVRRRRTPSIKPNA